MPVSTHVEAIQGEDVEPLAASVHVSHDDEFVYVLLQVEDDYNWNPEDGRSVGILGGHVAN